MSEPSRREGTLALALVVLAALLSALYLATSDQRTDARFERKCRAVNGVPAGGRCIEAEDSDGQ